MTRTEHDALGALELPADSPWGIHTHRATAWWPAGPEPLRADLFQALLEVKEACARGNGEAGLLPQEKVDAICGAAREAREVMPPLLPPLHPLQGGAGTSTNMAANELLANLGLRRLGHPFGTYEHLHPLQDVNLSQSTNDVYPTAVRMAVIRGLDHLHAAVEAFLAALLEQERRWGRVIKMGRTELQDAMPLTVGQEFSAWAEPMSRFRWRLSKAREWVREVNLGGTAVGTGINADLAYVASALEHLRQMTHLPLTLSRNLVDGTANADPLVEVSGLVRTGAVAIKKMANDWRLLSSGPQFGLDELRLPALQEGSSIMPGKVNPVLCEAAGQVALQVMGRDGVVAAALGESNLQLPQFLPLAAHNLLSGLEELSTILRPLADMVRRMDVPVARLAEQMKRSWSVGTLLAPVLGHETLGRLINRARLEGRSLGDCLLEEGLLTEDELDRLMVPEVLCAPGMPVLDEEEQP